MWRRFISIAEAKRVKSCGAKGLKDCEWRSKALIVIERLMDVEAGLIANLREALVVYDAGAEFDALARPVQLEVLVRLVSLKVQHRDGLLAFFKTVEREL